MEIELYIKTLQILINREGQPKMRKVTRKLQNKLYNKGF